MEVGQWLRSSFLVERLGAVEGRAMEQHAPSSILCHSIDAEERAFRAQNATECLAEDCARAEHDRNAEREPQRTPRLAEQHERRDREHDE